MKPAAREKEDYMKKEHSAPTMKDVAREAGVSIGTVSKVVNGLHVRDSYRIRIEDAIQKLNYKVNSYAKGLRESKTHTVALLIPNTRDPYFALLAYYINLALLKRKYLMLLCSTEKNPWLEQEYVTMVQQNKVDGIIGVTYNPDLIVEKNVPFVTIDRSIGSEIPCVASDNFTGGQMVAEKLADLGCKNVAFCRTGPTVTSEPDKRKLGFESGCLARGLTYEAIILNDGDSIKIFENFFQDHIHEGRLSFDGIFCVTDKVAHCVIKIVRKLGLRVPEDVQVIGYDGLLNFGYHGYTCSTIVQPVSEIAEMSVRLLFQDDTEAKPSLVCLPVAYAYGGTTYEPGEIVDEYE